jgi:hypothetical protein
MHVFAKYTLERSKDKQVYPTYDYIEDTILLSTRSIFLEYFRERHRLG